MLARGKGGERVHLRRNLDAFRVQKRRASVLPRSLQDTDYPPVTLQGTVRRREPEAGGFEG